MAWVIALALLGAVVLVLVFVPLRLRLSLQGQGDPSGAWALAGGVQMGPVSLSGAAAHGVSPRGQLHVFGKRVLQLPRNEEPAKAKRAQESAEEEKKSDGVYARLSRRIDPLELALFVVNERKRVKLGHLDLELDYSFEDVALTGKILGAVYALSGMFPGRVRIQQNVSWESVDRARGAMTSELELWPGLAVLDAAGFLLQKLGPKRLRA